MKIKHTVTTTYGKRMVLTTDDTFTLAFPGMIESTPKTLSQWISRKSLLKIASSSTDANEVSKANKALGGGQD